MRSLSGEACRTAAAIIIFDGLQASQADP